LIRNYRVPVKKQEELTEDLRLRHKAISLLEIAFRKQLTTKQRPRIPANYGTKWGVRSEAPLGLDPRGISGPSPQTEGHYENDPNYLADRDTPSSDGPAHASHT